MFMNDCRSSLGEVSAGAVPCRTVENRDVFAGAPMDGFTAFRQGTAPVETPPRDEARSFMNTSGSGKGPPRGDSVPAMSPIVHE